MAQGFESCGLSAPLVAAVKILGYEEMTPVQAQAIPLLLEGDDLIAQAATGSGKTAAFALPIIQRLHLRNRAPQAIVLCPTRELSTQVAKEMRRLGSQLVGLQVLIVAGGQPVQPQMAALERGVHVVVGTPGRILDLLKRRKLTMGALKVLVLDEADRLLDMGFGEEVGAILDGAPTERQTVLFSATMPSEIVEISQRYQQAPRRLTISPSESSAVSIRQFRLDTERDRKQDSLRDFLLTVGQTLRKGSTIVFCNQKSTVQDVAESLAGAGISCVGLSGDMEQFDRDRALARFRNGSVQVLVATDVVSRGIDVEDLDLVVNYDLPVSVEVYLHRIGRTGRAGKPGLAVSLVAPKEDRKIDAIEQFTGQPLLPHMHLLTSKPKAPDQPSQAALAGSMATLAISGGRRQKLRPGDILGALTGEQVGLASHQIGKIEIHDTYAYVAVPKNEAEKVLHCILNGQIKGRKFRVQLVP